jgi:hypothetical protein
VTFGAKDDSGKAVYHTNVLLSVAASYAIVCADAISEEGEREAVLQELEGSGKEIVRIGIAQMKRFAGNAFELTSKEGREVLVMSACAKRSLRQEQIAQLEKYAVIVAPDLATVESHGGGSARCCIAEIALPVSGG